MRGGGEKEDCGRAVGMGRAGPERMKGGDVAVGGFTEGKGWKRRPRERKMMKAKHVQAAER